MSAHPLTGDHEDDYEDVEETKNDIKTNKCGPISVYVQGNINNITLTTPVFMTVHDLGTNHTEFHKLVEHPCMAKLKARSVWLHVEIPGQEFDAPDLPESLEFPSMDTLAEELVNVLNYFNIKYCVTLGEGAGANIIARFAIAHPDRVLGNILIHPTPNVEGVMQYFHDKMMTWRLNTLGMNSAAEQYLVFHKFGAHENIQNRDHVIKDYIQKLYSRMNPKNLRLYVESFLARTDLTPQLKDKMKVDTMLCSGSRNSHSHQVDQMQAAMDPKLTTRVKLDDCGDVLQDTPEAFAYDLLLFCQGLGLFSALPVSRHGSICA
ncbi:uncharacterized protein ZK1073.1-like [Oppia nitens]|uniref:uncharacterized protein ZK1073.1-like n=1 Tax=Oppia nitens TaxID=1686743 RepID=UPI0023DCBF92|nr:uncharacterized protein ZK1073.1-like [Oppia nitens]XP_054165501.1 uncharacterized protein ZK1073.1-like [Oppia nitens]XP_054165509.1 uncharacterized protein ZK1073.1-like [Oppia nitens]